MNNSRTSGAKGDNATADSVLLEVIKSREKGESVDYERVLINHPHLRPELDEKLKTLRTVNDLVMQTAQMPGRGIPRAVARPAELAFLQDELEGYEVLEVISRGGQGTVYRAIQKSPRRTVAIKVLLDSPIASERRRLRFEREVDLVSKVRHPSIVNVYERGTVKDRLYFTMPFIDGLPIDDFVLLQSSSVHERVSLVCKVCKAVSAAHQMGVIHRDLKPSNIVVTPEGEPYVLDFGLAKFLLADESEGDTLELSLTGEVVGTLRYLSPEQAAGRTSEIDTRTDVYSVGLILYCLLTGSSPYPVQGDRNSILRNIQSVEPTNIFSALREGDPSDIPGVNLLNDDLNQVVLKSLDKDPQRRYQSMAAFADDLDNYLQGEVVQAKAASRLYLLRKMVRRYRTQAIFAAAFGVLLVASLVSVTVLWRRAAYIAATAQAALNMGSYVKMGTVEGDVGGSEQAIELFTAALDISRTAPSDDPIVQQFTFDALHQLCELHFDLEDVATAVPYCTKAGTFAQTLLDGKPDDPEWLRRSAFSQVVRGRVAMAQKKWRAAIDLLNSAMETFDVVLAKQEPYVAYALGLRSSCFRNLTNFDAARHDLKKAREIRIKLLRANPDSLAHGINLVQIYVKLTALCLSEGGPESAIESLRWNAKGNGSLESVRKVEGSPGRQFDIDRIQNDLDENKEKANKLLSRSSG